MKFVSFLKYTEKGISNVQQTVQRSKEFIDRAKAAGIEINQLLWTQGRYDGVVIFEAPDAETAAALMLQQSSLGNIKSETLVAFDADAMANLLAKEI